MTCRSCEGGTECDRGSAKEQLSSTTREHTSDAMRWITGSSRYSARASGQYA